MLLDRPAAQALAFALALAGFARSNSVAAEPPGDAARREFFETRIRPVLASRCYECHGATKHQGGLRLDWRGGLLTGGDSGPAVEVGQPDDSPLVLTLEHQEPGKEMPKGSERLSDNVLRDFRGWIASGAYDPRDAEPTTSESGRDEWEAKLAERRNWWSLQPLGRPETPTPRDVGWVLGEVDRFVLAKLETSGLAPSPPADRSTLARRLAFVLTGLPPESRVLREFENGGDYEALVDRMLASPHFGERWARHWMDAVRYTDTYGYEWDIAAKGAWRYRDYLTRAFNADVPYDRLVREQVAGDLLPDPRIDPVEGVNLSLIGPMMYQLGEKRHGDSANFNGIHQEMLHNKIDAFSKAFQATTVGCARCHDHKLDAVSQRDYYALAGALMSPRWVTRTVDTPERDASVRAELKGLKRPLREALSSWWLTGSGAWLAELRGESAGPGPWSRVLEKAGEAPPVEHPLRLWVEARKAAASGGDVAATWAKLADELAATHRDRAAANAKAFRLVADFRGGVPTGWSAEGAGFFDGPARPGEFTVALDGPAALSSILPGGLFSHALSPRLNGAIRSPFLSTIDGPWVSLEVLGGDFGAERTVVDNAFLTERQTYLGGRELVWLATPPFPEFAGRRVYREIATKTSNPNFPPRVGLGGRTTAAQEADSRSWIGLTRVLAHKEPGTPQDELAYLLPLIRGSAPVNLAEAADRYVAWARASVERWGLGEADDDDVRRMNWLLDQSVLPNHHDGDAPAPVGSVVAAYREVESRLRVPQTVNGMLDQEDGQDYRLNERGEYDRLGPPVPRGYLGVLGGGGAAFRGSGSGRRELAERVASAENPLTPRVYANRLWQWVFGTGLVATPDDFGRLGEAPSHPELLDFLARRLVDRGWSTKGMVRELVLSAAFRQGSSASTPAREADPADRLLHHFPLRRLEAEEVRDAILATSGRLDRRLYGPSIDPPRPKEDAEKRLFSGPVDGLGRRSLYIKVAIMEPPRFLATFNQPAPKIPAGRRDVTTLPAQALALLNDPFVLGQARFWGEQVAADRATDPDVRLADMIRAALGREADAAELAGWRGVRDDLARERGVGPDSPEAWADVAHSLFNLKEFLYIR